MFIHITPLIFINRKYALLSTYIIYINSIIKLILITIIKKSTWINRLTDLEKGAIDKIDRHSSKLSKENETILHGEIKAYKDHIKYLIKLTVIEVNTLYKHELINGDDALNSVATGVKNEVVDRVNTLCADIDNIIAQQNDKLQEVKVSDITDLNKVQINHNFKHKTIKAKQNKNNRNIFGSKFKKGDVVHATDGSNSNYGTIMSVDVKKAKDTTIKIIEKKIDTIKDSYKTEVAAVIPAIASYFVPYAVLKRENKLLSAVNVVKEAKLQYSESNSKKTNHYCSCSCRGDIRISNIRC